MDNERLRQLQLENDTLRSNLKSLGEKLHAHDMAELASRQPAKQTDFRLKYAKETAEKILSDPEWLELYRPAAWDAYSSELLAAGKWPGPARKQGTWPPGWTPELAVFRENGLTDDGTALVGEEEESAANGSEPLPAWIATALSRARGGV